MISDALSSLSDLLLGEAAHGRALPPERAAAIAAIVLDLSARVAVMEAQPMPLACEPDWTEEEVVAMLVAKGWTVDDARSRLVWEQGREP